MKPNRGTTNVTTLLSVLSFMGLDLVAIRLGLMRSVRLMRTAWSMVPQPSMLGLTLGAISLVALALTMWWHKLSAESAATRASAALGQRHHA